MIEKISVLTCPHCGHKEEIEMPDDFCMYYYDCKKCGKKISPKYGDCCVFCSYGTVPCPPIQMDNNSCCKPE